MASRRQKGDASNQIIVIQSVLLFSFGLAAWSASSVIIAGMDAMSSSNAAAVFITEDQLITNETIVDSDIARSVVVNFEFICFSALIVSSMILACTLYRMLRR